MINQELKAQGRNIKCCLILGVLPGARGAQRYEFSRMLAQFLPCPSEKERSQFA